MSDRKVTLTETIRAQVALLFGRYRPAGGMTAEEQAAVRAERVEFADRLSAIVRAIDANEAALVFEIRRITRELYNDPQAKMPSVESIASRVKASFRQKDRAPCFGCEDSGGWYEHAGNDEPLRPRRRGDVEWPGHGWLCLGHHQAANWYLVREAYRRGIPGVADRPPLHEYPPPVCLLPSGAWNANPPAHDPKWGSFTDGGNMGPVARWAVAFVLRARGWRVGETETPLLEEGAAAAPAPDPEAWRMV